MGNEIATKHSKSDIDQFPQIRPLSPQDNFSTKHPQSPQNFPPNRLFAKPLPEETRPIRPIIFNRVPAPTRSARSAIHQYSADFICMPVQPPAQQNFCHIGQEASDLSGLGSDSHRATVTHPYRAGVAIPIEQEPPPTSGRRLYSCRGFLSPGFFVFFSLPHACDYIFYILYYYIFYIYFFLLLPPLYNYPPPRKRQKQKKPKRQETKNR